jgi:hypothetical protein
MTKGTMGPVRHLLWPDAPFAIARRWHLHDHRQPERCRWERRRPGHRHGAGRFAITGSGATYNVAVTGMTSGTVIPSLTAAAASDATGNASAASSSTDHAVIYTAVTALSGTAYIDGKPGPGDQISGTTTPGATITITESRTPDIGVGC